MSSDKTKEVCGHCGQPMEEAFCMAVPTKISGGKGKLLSAGISIFDAKGFTSGTLKVRGLCSQRCCVLLFNETMNDVFHPDVKSGKRLLWQADGECIPSRICRVDEDSKTIQTLYKDR